MYCPACGAANVDGAKFCGTCGTRIEVAAAPAAAAPIPTADTAATIVRAPVVDDGSLVARPRGRGKLWAVLGLDVALLAGGAVLATRPASAPAAGPTGGVAAVELDAGAQVATGGSTGGGSTGSGSTGGSTGGGSTGGGSTGGGSTGGGSTGGGSTAGGSTGGGSTGGGSTGGGSTGGGSTGGGSTGVGSIDAGSAGGGLDDRLWDAAVAPPVVVDASSASQPIDAGVAPPPDAPAADPDPTPIDADDGEVSAAAIGQEFARQVVASEGKLGRCYQTSTKALPDDQPIVGEVDIALSVMPTGRIDNVRVDRNTTGSNTLANCVLAVVQAWSFSPHDGAGALAFARTFRFGPGQ